MSSNSNQFVGDAPFNIIICVCVCVCSPPGYSEWYCHVCQELEEEKVSKVRKLDSIHFTLGILHALAEHKIRKEAWLVVCPNNAHFDQSLVQFV